MLEPYAWAENLAEQLDPTPSPYRRKPITWVREKLGEYLTRDQRDIMRSVVKNRYTAVKSAHDTGKSFDVSRLAGWWVDSHPLGEALVVSTAPTAAQVGAIVWREIGIVHRKGKLPGRVTGDNQWKIVYGKQTALSRASDHDEHGQDLVAIGRKPADYDPSAFQGLHRRYVLVIIDEACGVPKNIFDAADALATNRNARVIAIGNPDDPNSHFATVCKPGSGWNVIRIDGLRTVGFSKERVRPYPQLMQYMREHKIPFTKERAPELLYDMLLDPEWVEERLKRWGAGSPMFTSKVRGEFPLVAIDSLIHPHLVTLAQAREEKNPANTLARMGVDVARYGRDHTIIILRKNGMARVVVDIPYGPTTETAGHVQRIGLELGVAPPVACVDDVGVGGGVVDILEENGYPVAPIIGSESCVQLQKNGTPRFNNKRSELFWNLKEALAGPSGTGDDGWLDLDPDDDELAAQLTNIKYKVNSKGQICVEGKEDMIARGLPSPDRADALCYSVAPDEPRIRGGIPMPDRMITGDLLNVKW